MAPDMGKKAGGWDIQEIVCSYLNEVWPPHLILHPVLLSQLSLSVSYLDYPPSVPSLLPQPDSSFGTNIHFPTALHPHSSIQSPSLSHAMFPADYANAIRAAYAIRHWVTLE